MPMGIVSDTDFNKEVERVVPNGIVKDMPTRGRKEGDTNVPDSLRKIIGETSVTDGPAEAVALAKSFGISQSSASAYGVGATSTASYHDRPNLPVINDAKTKIQKRARAKLHKALNALTDDKIGESKAIEIASIAKTMSAIIKDMEPEPEEKDRNNKGNGPTFVFMAPPIIKEDVFDAKYVAE